ncbi:MAG: hypothetical protein ABIH00_00475 [Armatimonadota bacterium]
MKTFIKWTSIILAVILIFAFLLFPYEILFNGFAENLKQKSNIKTGWENGSFYPWKHTLNNVTCVMPDNSKISYDKVTVHPFLIGLKIYGHKEGGKDSAILRGNEVSFDIKNFKLPGDSGRFSGGVLNLAGDFNTKDLSGEGSFTLKLNNLNFLNIKENAEIKGYYTAEGGKTFINFDVTGKNLSGSGEVSVSLSTPFEQSRITGTAYLYYNSVGKKVNITGNIKNLMFLPEG